MKKSILDAQKGSKYTSETVNEDKTLQLFLSEVCDTTQYTPIPKIQCYFLLNGNPIYSSAA